MAKYISSAEAAAILGVHQVNVANFCKSGKLSGAMKIGHSWCIPEESVLNLKSERENRQPPSGYKLIKRLVRMPDGVRVGDLIEDRNGDRFYFDGRAVCAEKNFPKNR